MKAVEEFLRGGGTLVCFNRSSTFAIDQFKLPVKNVVAGIGRRDHTAIFVSRGVGTVYVPYRLNCPPDVSVITLRTRSA